MSTAEAEEEVDYNSPSGRARYWQAEFKAAREYLEKWREGGDKIIKRFLDTREDEAFSLQGRTRWNLFTSNTQLLMAMLYGALPRVAVSRRFADANDDVGRVAGETMERLLNTDIEREDDNFSTALGDALNDWLLPGGGFIRLRYVAEFETRQVEAQLGENGEVLAEAYEEEAKTREDVETDYVHWRDVLWSPARVWRDVRWIAFKTEMSRRQLVERFGEKIGKAVPLNSKMSTRKEGDEKKLLPWGRADVWEVWDKENGRRVCWYVEGMSYTLDEKEDTLGLEGFWPCPKPLMANLTTTRLIPRADYAVAQDLYEEIDSVSTRITLLERAIRVVGLYDKRSGELQNLLQNTNQNEMVPVDKWAAFAEKGGIKGSIEWLPLQEVVGALMTLRDYRRELIDALNQIIGLSDIMRGQATTPGVTATEQGIKARFGSVRVQRYQDEFARFATDAQKLRAEIISKHFSPETILERANCEFTADAALAPQAVELIKSKFAQYRIEVKSEALSMTDFAQLKSERMEYLTGLSAFMQAAAPMMADMSQRPYVLKVLQWTMSGLKGSAQIEGILDQAIAAAEQAAQQAAMNPPQQQPDPKMLTQQLKGQQDLAKVQAELQADLIRTQAEAQADAQREQNQAVWNTREAAQKAMISRAMKPAEMNGGV